MTRHSPPDDAESAPDEELTSDAEHVRELRERIARGEYRPDPEAIARRILERGDLDHETADAPDGAPSERPLRIVPPAEDGETSREPDDDEGG
jgi:hypothetical protein